MTRPSNIGLHGENSQRFNEVIEWVAAFDAFDFCDPMPLERLLRSDQEIPPELRPALADIISGKRQPNKKAAIKLKVPAADRLMIAAHVSVLLGIIDMAKHEFSFDPIMSDDPADRGRAVELRANQRRVEVSQEVALTDQLREEPYEIVMNHFCISRETVENMVRSLREKMRDYPNI